jgi:hypothetical protein
MLEPVVEAVAVAMVVEEEEEATVVEEEAMAVEPAEGAEVDTTRVVTAAAVVTEKAMVVSG